MYSISFTWVLHFIIARYYKIYDSIYNLCLTENSIRPEKYIVEGYPPVNAFPAEHPNRILYADTLNRKDEL